LTCEAVGKCSLGFQPFAKYLFKQKEESQEEWRIVSHNCLVCRPSKLPEEDAEGHFSSSLDLSEIRLNFDLEESEMRIFSEDETLISTSMGSGSIMSHASPRVGSSCRVRQQMVSVSQWLTRYNLRTEVQLPAAYLERV